VVLTLLFGLFAVLLSSQFLGETESETFSTFLKGQIGFSSDALSSALFWKMTVAFLLGAGGGYLAGLEIPRRFLAVANGTARFVAIVVLTLVIYIPAMTAGFLWDDDQEITANPSLVNGGYGLWEIWTGGLSNPVKEATDPGLVKAIRVPLQAIEKHFWPERQFKAHPSADYFPLKATMLWVEFQLWGRKADGSADSIPFHVMNIILHALDALLLWLVLSQLKVPGAWLGALLFAIHPVHVESVAWIAERKNTLSLLFYLLSISAWVKFEDTMECKKLAQKAFPRLFDGKTSFWKRLLPWAWKKACQYNFYLFSLLFCLAALLCKTSVVVLPAVLLLCIWWRKGKLTLRDCLLIVPFLVISAGLALVTVWFQNDRAIGGEVIPIGDTWSRIAGAGFASWWYLEKVLVPIHLNTIYNAVPILPADLLKTYGIIQTPGPQASQFIKGAALLILLFGTFAAYLLRDKQRTRLGRTPFFVLAYFLGTLFPVMGFFKMSYMRVALQADHFQYLSDIAVIALVAAAITWGWEKAGARVKPFVVAACALLICSFSAYSWERAGVHQSEKTLWSACLKDNWDSWQAHNHLGAVIYMEKDYPEAHKHFTAAVSLKPANPEVHNNLGLTLAQRGEMEAALAQYAEAVRIKGDVPAMRRNYADCLGRLGHLEEAVTQYKAVLEQDPNDAAARAGLGYAFIQLHRYPEAQQQFEIAIRLDPNDPHLRQNLESLKKMIVEGR
jgi:tetratricopeptide (TPR) repeat protein